MGLLDWLSLAAPRYLNVCVDFSFFVVFCSKALGVGWLFVVVVFCLKKSLAPVSWLLLLIFIGLVGGLVVVHFQKLLWWGWIGCKRWPSMYLALHGSSFEVVVVIFSTARCSSSRNSLRGIHSIHPSPSPHFGGGATSSFDGIFHYNLFLIVT